MIIKVFKNSLNNISNNHNRNFIDNYYYKSFNIRIVNRYINNKLYCIKLRTCYNKKNETI
jgi:hypothetical protein